MREIERQREIETEEERQTGRDRCGSSGLILDAERKINNQVCKRKLLIPFGTLALLLLPLSLSSALSVCLSVYLYISLPSLSRYVGCRLTPSSLFKC